MLNKLNILKLTDTVKRLTLWNALLFIVILLVLNIIVITLINYILHENIDARLRHEMENILKSFEVKNDSIIIVDFREFEERDLQEITDTPYFLQIYNRNGEIIITSDNILLYKPIPFDQNFIPNDFFFEDVKLYNDRLRIGYASILNEENEYVATLQLATFEAEYSVIMQRVLYMNIILFPFLLIFVLLASIFLAKHSYSPLNKIIDTAKRISSANMSARIKYDAKSDDELGKVRDTLNNLFDRLENYFRQISQFTDHASHQLLNPLTSVKAEIDFVLKKQRDNEAYVASLQIIREQTDRMIKIIKTLLVLSKQDRETETGGKIFNLSRMITEKTAYLFSNDRVSFKIEKDIYIKGDEEQFEIIIENLIDNALKYSEKSEKVEVELEKNNRFTELRIKDYGLGIDDNEKQKVFDRFYRTERTQKLGIKGYGLGLSLVKAIVLQSGGTISIENNKPKGTIISVSLPVINIS